LSARSEKLPFGLLYISRHKPIVVVVDGGKTFTFRAFHENPRKKFFYNASVAVVNNQVRQAQLLRYDMKNDSENQYYSRQKSFGNFKGTVKRYKLPTTFGKEFDIWLYGKKIRGKAINLYENGTYQIRIDDFWSP